MAQLQSLSIQGKDLTNSLTQVKTTTFIVSGANDARIVRSGNVCTLSIDGKMNGIPATPAWRNCRIGAIPTGYRPAISVRTKLLCDGDSDWSKDFIIGTFDSEDNTYLYLITRSSSYDASTYGDSHGYWISMTYVTNDDFPAS